MADSFNMRIGFTASSGIGDVIRLATNGEVNHVLLIFFDPVFNCDLTIGANPNGLTIERLCDLSEAHGTLVQAFAPVDGFPSLVIGLRVWADYLNKPYDYAGLVGMSIVEAAERMGLQVDNPFNSVQALFCSEYATNVIRSSGYDFIVPGMEAGSVDPQRLYSCLKVDVRFREIL